jgi:sugar phosphate isomerase/epimerase
MAMARRAFLAAAAAPLCAAAGPGAWKMRLSTSTVMFNSLPVEQACAQVAAAGFEGVDLWQGERFHCNHLNEVAERLGPDGLLKLLTDNGLKLTAFTCYLGIPHHQYAEALGKAGGGEGVLIRESEYNRDAAGRAVPAPPPGAELRQRMRTFMESLKPALELAERYDYRIAIENHSGAILNSIESFKAFLEFGVHPRLGIALAPYHLQVGNSPVEEVIALVGKRMLFFYAWQREPGVRQLPGAGSTDFTPWLKALAKADYRGYVNPFMHGPLGKSTEQELALEEMSAALVESRRYLERCRTRFT